MAFNHALEVAVRPEGLYLVPFILLRPVHPPLCMAWRALPFDDLIAGWTCGDMERLGSGVVETGNLIIGTAGLVEAGQAWAARAGQTGTGWSRFNRPSGVAPSGNAGGVRLGEASAGSGDAVGGNIRASTGAMESDARDVFFGQKRVSPTFGMRGPPHLAGRTISAVASDLRSGILTPDHLPIEAFRHPVTGQLVSANTRSLAALSEAGMKPTRITIIEPNSTLLLRLRDIPIIPDAPLPGNRVPVTPSQGNNTILRIIELP